MWCWNWEWKWTYKMYRICFKTRKRRSDIKWIRWGNSLYKRIVSLELKLLCELFVCNLQFWEVCVIVWVYHGYNYLEVIIVLKKQFFYQLQISDIFQWQDYKEAWSVEEFFCCIFTGLNNISQTNKCGNKGTSSIWPQRAVCCIKFQIELKSELLDLRLFGISF